MDRATLSQRIESILNEITRLSNTLYAMDNTNMALTAMRHGIVMNTSRIISSYRLKSCPSCCRQIL